MNWIFVGLLLGSTVTSQHASREACEGRAVLLREKGVVGKCQDLAATSGLTISSTGITWGSTSNPNVYVPTIGDPNK